MRLELAIALATAVCAAAWVLFVARTPNPAIGPDSVSYLSAAEAIAQGHGPLIPFADWSNPTPWARLKHFPPAFPAAIAFASRLGIAPLAAARLVETLAAATTAGLIVVSVAASVPGTLGAVAGALAAAVAFATPAIVLAHAIVLSEPMFFALLVLALFTLARERPPPLVLGAIAAAAMLVRYAGVSICLASCVALFLEPGRLRARIRNVVLAAAPSVLALVAWQRWTGGFRHYGYRPGLFAALEELWPTLNGWIAPSAPASPLRDVVTLAGLCALALAIRSAAGTSPERTPFTRLRSAACTLALCYTLLVVFSRIYADPDIPFDWRLLAPVILLAEIVTVAALAVRLPSAQRRAQRAALTLVAVWFAASVSVVTREAIDVRLHAWGYGAPEWQRSQLADWLRHEGQRYTLYTDNPAALWEIARLASRTLPEHDDPRTLSTFERLLHERKSAVIAVSGPLVDTVAPETLAHRSMLRLRGRFDKGTVWIGEPRDFELAHARSDR